MQRKVTQRKQNMAESCRRSIICQRVVPCKMLCNRYFARKMRHFEKKIQKKRFFRNPTWSKMWRDAPNYGISHIVLARCFYRSITTQTVYGSPAGSLIDSCLLFNILAGYCFCRASRKMSHSWILLMRTISFTTNGSSRRSSNTSSSWRASTMTRRPV